MSKEQGLESIKAAWSLLWEVGVSDLLTATQTITPALVLRAMSQSPATLESADIAEPLTPASPYRRDRAWTDVLQWPLDSKVQWLAQFPEDLLSDRERRILPNGLASPLAVLPPGPLASLLQHLNDAFGSSSLAEVYEEFIRASNRSYYYQVPEEVCSLMARLAVLDSPERIIDVRAGIGSPLLAAATLCNPAPEIVALETSPDVARVAELRFYLQQIDNVSVHLERALEVEEIEGREGFSAAVSAPSFGQRAQKGRTYFSSGRYIVTNRPELMAIAASLRALKDGGRAVVLVADGVLFGTSSDLRNFRKILLEEYSLEAVVKLPRSVFRPFSSINASVLVLRNQREREGRVWYHEIRPDELAVSTTSNSSGECNLSRGLNLLVQQFLSARRGAGVEAAHSQYSFLRTLERLRGGAEVALDFESQRSARAAELSIERGGLELRSFAKVRAGAVSAQEIDRTSPPVDNKDAQERVLHPTWLTSPLPRVELLPGLRGTRRSGLRLEVGDVIGRDLAGDRNWTVVPDSYRGVLVGQGVLVIRLTDALVSPEYLAFYLRSPQAEAVFPKNGVIPKLNRSGMEGVVIPPCSGSNEEHALLISKVERGIENIEGLASKLREASNKVFESTSERDRAARLRGVSDSSYLASKALTRYEDPYRTFQDTYPYAIARSVRKLQNARRAPDRHEAALQCIDSIVTSLGIVALSVLSSQGQTSTSELEEWVDAVRGRGVSLGHWMGVLRAAGRYSRESGRDELGLGDATASRRREKGLLAHLDDLVQYRNKVRHGGGPRTRAEVEDGVANLTELLHPTLLSCAFLARTQWVHVEGLNWRPGKGEFLVDGSALMGDHPDFEMVSVRSKLPIASDILYLTSNSESFVSLAPFCFLLDCSNCYASELFYVDRISTEKAILKSLDRGHEMRSERVKEDLDNWLKVSSLV